jgi:predicted phage terminase large subunit-like protein
LLQDVRRETKLPVIGILPTADKITRASGVSALIEAGKVALPLNAAWLTDYEAEMLTFPNSPHFDQVDSTTQFLAWQREKAGRTVPRIRGL